MTHALDAPGNNPPSITCPRCSAVSYNPQDISAGYCGRCHDYTSPEYGPPLPHIPVLHDAPPLPASASPWPNALVMSVTRGLLPPPWFVPADEPACCALLIVPPEATADGIPRRFFCDRIAGHTDQLAGAANRHRQVYDVNTSNCFTWPADGQAQVDAYVARVKAGQISD